VLNSTAIASGYAGHDPQGVMIHKEGLAMEAFCKFSFRLQRMVKVLLLVHQKKKKNNFE